MFSTEHSLDWSKIGGLAALSCTVLLPVGGCDDLSCEDAVIKPDVC